MQLFLSAGHIAPLLVSRGPHFSQKGSVKAKKISLRGPDVARGPYVAPSCFKQFFNRRVMADFQRAVDVFLVKNRNAGIFAPIH